MEGCFELYFQNYYNKIMYFGEVFGEVVFFSNEYWIGSVVVLDKFRLLAFFCFVFFEQEELLVEVKVNILCCLMNQIIKYFFYNLQCLLVVLVSWGENVKVEFKVFYNCSFGVKVVIFRMVVVMFNFEGGSILLGIKNDGEVFGFNGLDMELLDQAVMSLINYILDKLGKEYCDFIDVYGDEINGKIIFCIDCMLSKVFVFMFVVLF